MIVTINIPDSVVDEAKARGISVEALVRERIEIASEASGPVSPTSKRVGSGTTASEEAVGSMEMRQRYMLNDAEIFDSSAISMTPAEAGAAMRETRKRYTLGGTVTIRQLIEEGRRY